VAPWPAGSAPETDSRAGYALIGNAGEIFGERLAAFSAARVSDFAARPSGMAVASIGRRALLAGLALPPERALPEYVRDKVALTIQEREVERARRDAALLATRDKQDLNTEAVPLATTAPSKTPRSEPMNE
jgi:tRNA threonylcarbamoyladenosine biosynthesis protein TsaB